jgi:hypothetical protein
MDNGTTVRAGSIVYRRNGSRNTPINSSASAAKIENMWRERFGLDQTPAVRITGQGQLKDLRIFVFLRIERR